MMMPPHEVKQRSWSDLPLNLLEVISDHLIGPDHCCFLAVCKTWRSIYFSMEAMLRKKMKFPLLVSTKSDSTFYFSNPILCRTSEIANSNYKKIVQSNDETEEEKSDDDQRFKYFSLDQEKRILYAKDGWLLMSQGEDRLFFFNPLTEQRIDLPKFPSSSFPFETCGICFSTTPTSPDCIVFSLQFHGHWVVANYIRHGQDSWTNHEISLDEVSLTSSYCSPIFHNGQFHMMATMRGLVTKGYLITYNPEKCSELNVLEKLEEPCASIRNCYLLEWNGKVVSVFTGFMGQRVGVYCLDTSSENGTWKKINNLGDNTFFLGELSSLSLTATDLQVSRLENRIYFPRYSTKNGTGIFYNLQTNKFQTFWDQQEDFYNSVSFSNCAWIIPDHLMYKDEELNWLHHVA